MKMQMYSVQDIVAKVFTQPFFQLNDDVAKRTMRCCVENKEHNYGQSPADYYLWRIGVYDDSTGEIVQESECICCLASLEG